MRTNGVPHKEVGREGGGEKGTKGCSVSGVPKDTWPPPVEGP